MEELYIVDEEFENYKEIIMEIDNAIEIKLSDIIAALAKACDAISEGNLHINLSSYVEKLSTMKGQLVYLTSEMQTDSENFCTDIATIDTLND